MQTAPAEFRWKWGPPIRQMVSGEFTGVSTKNKSGVFAGRSGENIRVLAACCALVLAGCSDSIDPGAPDEAAASSEATAPVVVLSDAWEPPTLTEAAILADRLLRREDDSLLLDAAQRRELADEITAVLSRIRQAYPAVTDVTARATYATGELILALEPWLFEVVSSLLDDSTGSVELRTGHAEFDLLNARLGLSVVVRIFQFSGTVVFYFNEYLNVAAAAPAYAALEGIEYAEPNAYVGDGSDVDAVESEGRWYVVFRRAWGDCPAGCINETLDFFIVSGDGIERVERTQAMERIEFRDLVMTRGWN